MYGSRATYIKSCLLPCFVFTEVRKHFRTFIYLRVPIYLYLYHIYTGIKRRICAPGQPDSAPQVYKTRWNDRLRCLVDVRFDAPASTAAGASLTVLARRGS